MDRISHKKHSPSAVIVDYGLGNLFSVDRALRHVGAEPVISHDPAVILDAGHLVLPGVGSFGDGMRGLKERGLVEAIRSYVRNGRPLLGICLGMQLMMREGEEFGLHEGLGIFEGRVTRMRPQARENIPCKVPHVGWNTLLRPDPRPEEDIWKDTILRSLKEGASMYFVHSNIVIPDDASRCIARTEYYGLSFCSAIRSGNVYGCQFHPERSGEEGLSVYKSFIFGEPGD